MSDQTASRLGANEALFREVNEAIERGQWPGEEQETAAFRCECARLDCAELLRVTPRAYEQVREHARRFVVLPGHENPKVEIVVVRTPDYVVVEKTGEAGREAEEADPRP